MRTFNLVFEDYILACNFFLFKNRGTDSLNFFLFSTMLLLFSLKLCLTREPNDMSSTFPFINITPTLIYRVLAFKLEQRRLTTSIYSVVKTGLGSVRGIKRKTIWGDYYFSFEKIPFAKPPLGELRFKAPVPAEPWECELDCTAAGNKPLQTYPLFSKFTGNEDCLYLNVYAKDVSLSVIICDFEVANNLLSFDCSCIRPSFALWWSGYMAAAFRWAKPHVTCTVPTF